MIPTSSGDASRDAQTTMPAESSALPPCSARADREEGGVTAGARSYGLLRQSDIFQLDGSTRGDTVSRPAPLEVERTLAIR